MNDETKTRPVAGGDALRMTRRQAVTLVGAAIAVPAVMALNDLEPAPANAAMKNGSEGAMLLQNLRCEYRVNPIGIDVVKPRMSWTIGGAGRGARQTAYQILVASSPEALALGKGDLWDSGRVKSDRSSGVAYAGKNLSSRVRCFWKARVWDQNGKETPWSEEASCTLGLLNASDWKANWVTEAALADEANRPRTPIHCYRSEIAHSADTVKWIVLDLGASKTFDGACLQPAKPAGTNGDISTVWYPVRFKIEVSDSPDFGDAKTIVDRTAHDLWPPHPGFSDPERYRFAKVTGRYVRLWVSRLALWDGSDYVLGLGRFQVFDGDNDIAAGAQAKASDSVETTEYSVRNLTDPQAKIAYSATPEFLKAHVDGVTSVSRVPMLRREFEVDGKVRSATLYCSARGFYEARLNGKRVSEDLLAPGYTEYNRQLAYQAYDVSQYLQGGANVLGALLAYGWYAGRMNLNDNAYIYGYFPQLLAQLEIEYADGRREVICSDSAWKTSLDGPVRWSDLLDGEGYDCRKELSGWDLSGFDASAWKSPTVVRRDNTPIEWQRAQPVRRMQELKPVAVKQVAPGVTVFDMGQEFAGWCRVNADGPAGTRITLKHTEMRHADGTINRDNLWGTSIAGAYVAAQEDYFLDGRGPRVLEPHFTYHGIRFVEVTGLAQPATVDTLVGIHARTDAKQVGHFECSNTLYNKLMTASRWTQQNMMYDIPNGCAGRSERLGWSGDIRPCVQTALFHFDSAAFFEKFSHDLRVSQSDEGRFTDICPHAHLRDTNVVVGSPGWADAGVSLPWELYLNTGDARILSDHYRAACRWVDYIHKNNPDLLWTNARGMNWGDWLSAGPATPNDIGATAFFAHDADLVARMADALGHKADAARYRKLFAGIKAAFVRRFVTPEGHIVVSGASSDVTKIVRDLMKDQNLNLKVGWAALGDPAPNVAKTLRLTYKIGGHTETKDYPEESVISLSGNGQPLEIVGAIFGVLPDSSNTADVQGSYALALQFDLLDGPIRTRAAARLAQVIERDGGHPMTGFWSSVEMLKALSENGYHDVAARMYNLTTVPSWGHMVQGDSTTMWESFDADTQKLSLNHWTHSATGEWLWRYIAGIAPDEAQPGYQAVVIRPRPCAEVDWCKASYDSLRGPVSVDWKTDKDAFILNLTVPANMTATVYIPAKDGAKVTEGGRAAADAPNVRLLRREAGNNIYRIESGEYNFAVV
ncbi:MAG: family 78 glycoside hydrolase catalytic domain [Capsulimonas sp.]|uniref:family 78 glycoside hydrolase catalytic domain n=1 Tax=Capsulimonas sp. TaxID=2494211 RepID=UPI003264DC59